MRSKEFTEDWTKAVGSLIRLLSNKLEKFQGTLDSNPTAALQLLDICDKHACGTMDTTSDLQMEVVGVTGLPADIFINLIKFLELTHYPEIEFVPDVLPKLYDHAKKKVVLQYSKNDKIIATFDSVRLASERTGVPRQNIYQACRGKLKSAGGYNWRYSLSTLRKK